ncbi:MAG: T9SS C-terminal target domain-containing protein [Candidatus Zixiibacteriota bacterium]|nr:MAG: T9SS C-terminal target domain-containing protein [candidate division Zixibacteria bacterium]
MKKLFLVVCGLALLGMPQPSPAFESASLDAGSGGYGSVPETPAFTPLPLFTLENWVRLWNDEAPDNVILEMPGAGQGVWKWGVADGSPRFLLAFPGAADTVELATARPLPLGLWTHLALTCDGAALTLYQDGQPLANQPLQGSVLPFAGPLLVSSADPGARFRGWIDETRLSDTVRYADSFDPFTTPVEDLRVEDQEVTGWALGTGEYDLRVAWDSTSLYEIIDGYAPIYLAHNFQYAVQQYYYGQVGGHDVRLTLWMTDQGTLEGAEGLYRDPAVAPWTSVPVYLIGQEARLDTTLLFDYALDFYQDRYYVKVTVSKEWGAPEALAVATDFATATDANINDRYKYQPDPRTVALWHFDEGSGSVFADASGNGHHGTLAVLAWDYTIIPYEKHLYLAACRILEGAVTDPALDGDDSLLVAFSHPVAPVIISASTVDQALYLENGHTWLSGNGQLGGAVWNAGSDTVKIALSTAGGPPTVADGDTVRPNPQFFWTNSDSLTAGGFRFVRFDPVTGVAGQDLPALPAAPVLHPPHPTPFNAAARIAFDLPRPEEVSLNLYDLSGRLVSQLADGRRTAGRHAVTWKAEGAASGMYFVVLRAGETVQVRKAVLIR